MNQESKNTVISKGAKHFEKLQKKTVIDKTGRKRTVWVKIGEAAKQGGKKVVEEGKKRLKKEQDKYKDTNSEENDGDDNKSTLVQRKMKGIVKALKTEVKEWKTAGLGLKKLVQGETLTDHEKGAIKTTALHTAMIVGMSAMGGATGAALAGKIALGFMKQLSLSPVGHALAFAKGEESEGKEEDGSDAEAEHYLERMIISMSKYVDKQDQEDDKSGDEPDEKNK